MAKLEAGIPTTVAIATLVAVNDTHTHRNGRRFFSVSTRTHTDTRRNAEGGLTDIAPHRSPVDEVPIPHDRVDKPDERREAAPEDEQTRASVPGRSLSQVPGERDGGRSEGKEGEDGEYVVSGRHFRETERGSCVRLSEVGGRGATY